MKNHNAEGPHQDDDPNTHDADYEIDEEDILPEEDDPPLWVDSNGRTLYDGYEDEDEENEDDQDNPPAATIAQLLARILFDRAPGRIPAFVRPVPRFTEKSFYIDTNEVSLKLINCRPERPRNNAVSGSFNFTT